MSSVPAPVPMLHILFFEVLFYDDCFDDPTL